MEAYLHLWRYIGWLSGIEERFNRHMDSLLAAQSMLESIGMHLLSPDSSSRAIAMQVLDAVASRPPVLCSHQELVALTRLLSGDQYADALGVPAVEDPELVRLSEEARHSRSCERTQPHNFQVPERTEAIEASLAAAAENAAVAPAGDTTTESRPPEFESSPLSFAALSAPPATASFRLAAVPSSRSRLRGEHQSRKGLFQYGKHLVFGLVSGVHYGLANTLVMGMRIVYFAVSRTQSILVRAAQLPGIAWLLRGPPRSTSAASESQAIQVSAAAARRTALALTHRLQAVSWLMSLPLVGDWFAAASTRGVKRMVLLMLNGRTEFQARLLPPVTKLRILRVPPHCALAIPAVEEGTSSSILGSRCPFSRQSSEEECIVLSDNVVTL
jgi:hypothetical protein